MSSRLHPALLENERHMPVLRPRLTPAYGYREFAERVCGLDLSPLMAGIMDASEGCAMMLEPDVVALHFGAAPPLRKPRTVAVRAGGRAGKSSRLLATKALHAAWTVPLPTLNPGEVAVALLVAPDMKLARQALSFVKGYVDASPMLSTALAKDMTADTVTLRRPDGKTVRIEILAATRGGRAVRARTLVFAGMDEAAFFFAEGTGVINDADIYAAVAQRVVPGGQVWIVSTPWLADTGVLEKTIASEFGRHATALVCTAGTRALNPTWDPTGEIEADLRERDPDAARREIDGLPLAGSAASFFDPSSIDAAVDASLVLPRQARPGEQVAAGGDMGFRSDSAALCIAHHTGRAIAVAELLEMRPEAGKPLKPSEVVRAFAARMQAHHGVTHLTADGHYRETVTEYLDESGIGFLLAPQGSDGVSAVYVRARTLFREGRVKLPHHPRLVAQLKAVQWRPNQGGSVSILLPRDRGGHCDLVSALVLALWELGGLEVEAPDESVTSTMREHLEREHVAELGRSREDAALIAQMEQRHERRVQDEWDYV